MGSWSISICSCCISWRWNIYSRLASDSPLAFINSCDCCWYCNNVNFQSVIILVVGRVNYAAFYRKRPWIGNLCGVALECWHLGLTTYYVITRAVKLIVAAAIYIGRIDAPFLAEGVGLIGPVDLDAFPTIYRKDLLSADAHRHPFIERLGVIYLLKIKHGTKFATTAGSIWRL
mmetsp:Transcript_27401/g.41026  ORF Transcript_27401/g.41026 Transcript_27401/m.41026 type:complete len:174 (+) Transcript_27401:1566-2087(+)